MGFSARRDITKGGISGKLMSAAVHFRCPVYQPTTWCPACDKSYHLFGSLDDATAIKGWSKDIGHNDIEDEMIATISP